MRFERKREAIFGERLLQVTCRGGLICRYVEYYCCERAAHGIVWNADYMFESKPCQSVWEADLFGKAGLCCVVRLNGFL